LFGTTRYVQPGPFGSPPGRLEEGGQSVCRWLVLEEDGADLVADRQDHRVAAGERQRRRDRTRTLGDHARRALDRRGALTLRERHTELSVAREAAGAGQHQIAEPGQACERPGGGPEGDREPRHLGEPACDERGPRVLAEAEPVGDPGRDGHDVLQRPARLDADDVPVRVEPELARAETALEQGGQRVVT